MGEALGGRDPNPEAGEGPGAGPDHDRRQVRGHDAGPRERRLDRGQQRLTVPVASRPFGDIYEAAVGRAKGDDHPRRRRVDGKAGRTAGRWVHATSR